MIDIVITWVDGEDTALKEKRNDYILRSATPLHENGINPHRWVCSDELHYCLKSISNNAPWVRRVWIVTDNQTPYVSSLPVDFTRKISVIDHKEIFAGYQDHLPTFNSLSIETMLWRIPGLSEKFLYFNDDVFLTSETTIEDFFIDDGPVLRGKWADYSHLPDCSDSLGEAHLLNDYNQIKSAEMMGYAADNIFSSAHVVHPMQKSIMAGLFDSFKNEFTQNSTYRFRCTEQFLPQSLYNHYCLKEGRGAIKESVDYIHVPTGSLDRWTTQKIQDFLDSPGRKDIKFLCINDLPSVESSFPDARQWIEQAISKA